MGHEISWHIENAIIEIRLWGDITIDDFPEYDRLTLEHIEQSTHPLVHVWIDLTDVGDFPNNVGKVHKALTHLNHPRLGWSIVITESRVIRFVAYMITQMSKARFRAYNTCEEALHFLQTVDATLSKEF
jgi:hypothetical protein